jgi:exopolysaccharide biosynthesis polyprenyl glycosylphosphotransferase
MLNEQAKTFAGISRAADLGVIAASFAGAAAICQRLNGVWPLSWVLGLAGSAADAASPQYALLFLISLIAWIPVAEWRGTYHSHRTERSWSILWQDIVTQLLWVILTGCWVFLFKLGLISRSFFLIFLPLGMLLLNLRQSGVHILLRYLRRQGFNLRSVAVVGDRDRATRFSEIIKQEAGTGYRVVVQNGIDELAADNVSEGDLDEVFVLLGHGASDFERFLLKLVKRGKRVHIVPGIFDATLFRQSLATVAGVPVLSIGGFGMSRFQAGAKRLLDIIAPLLLLLVLGPVLAVVALAVKLSSPGPVLFTQERLGKGGQRFWIYKFRTMYQNAEKILHSDLAVYEKYIKNNYKLLPGEDCRITPIGRFLRTTSLDELPQLFNVLKGDMSLVGPRPIVPPEIEKYGDYGALFMSVRPGLTGNWQVSGRSEVSDYMRRAALDIEYIRDQSLKTDIDILFKTIPVVLSRRGAH